MSVAVLCGLVFWLVASQQGTRLLLEGVVDHFDGQVTGVQGSILKGVSVERLTVSLPEVTIDVSELNLDVNWGALGSGLLQVRELSAHALRVSMTADPDPDAASDNAPVQIPRLPIAIEVDHLALQEFALLRGGKPLPVKLGRLGAALAWGKHDSEIRLNSLHVEHDALALELQGIATVSKMADPWPFAIQLGVVAQTHDRQSPLCLYDEQKKATETPDATTCTLGLDLKAQGSLDSVVADLTAQGAGLVAAQATLLPREAFPLRSAGISLRRNDQSGGVSASVDWQPKTGSTDYDHLVATVAADQLELGRILKDMIPPALLTAYATVDVELQDQRVVRQASVDMVVERGSRWNSQTVDAVLKASVDFDESDPTDDQTIGALTLEKLVKLRIHALNLDMNLGRNRIRAEGDWATSSGALRLNALAPQLDAFWPGLSGAAELKGNLAGSFARHNGDIQASYTPARSNPRLLGRARMQTSLVFSGTWEADGGQDAGRQGWRATISRLQAESAGFSLSADRPVALTVLPDAIAPDWFWQVGQVGLTLQFPGQQRMVMNHAGSRGGSGRWQTAGRIDNLVITAVMMRQLMAALEVDRGASDTPRVNATIPDAQRRIALDANWDLAFDGTLSGKARVARRDGDLRIPGDPPIPLGLQTAALDIVATPLNKRSSRLDARLDVRTAAMGRVDGKGSAVMVVHDDGSMALDASQPMRATLDADISDLAWLSLLLGDAMEIGGTLKANVELQGAVGGAWRTRGTMRGEHIRVIRIDDGVRLVDGTLTARFDNDSLILDSLRFPASLRVIPPEWRTREWITKEPDAQGGYIDVSGRWNLFETRGQLGIRVHRFPILQRSDRYAMASGQIDITAALPDVAISGKLTADAGWISLEVLRGVPTLDDDVVVRRPGDSKKDATPAIRTTIDLTVDMGPRFYLTGLGLDAGLLGSIQILLKDDGRLMGIGALRTRDGGIEAYGQRLRLRRGQVTFQGRLDNPLLDIEALRTGEQVEAGVRVSGTAQRPRIDLVSYPDVSDVEKLSWLILGRGPDESGGDAALLVSIGTALLGGGQPFYRQFGLSDVSVRSGAIGSSGSLLPDRTVAGNVNRDSSSELATQFLVASKQFANGITLSVEQALAGSETVGRASYRLSRRWSIDIKGGSINGIALVYRTFFDD